MPECQTRERERLKENTLWKGASQSRMCRNVTEQLLHTISLGDPASSDTDDIGYSAGYS